MIATTTVQETTAEPTVTYDSVSKMIWAGVIVNATNIAPPVVAIPGPVGAEWTVIWTLVPGTGIASAVFLPEATGITLSPSAIEPPPLVVLESLPVPNEPNQWLVRFRNDAQGSSSFEYHITYQPTLSGDLQPQARVTHDPTIVVTTEPIDG